jgi:aryl-alcohol dehydrogenase-like predicted oxidoreductase
VILHPNGSAPVGFGLGLLEIGKPWGHAPGPVPNEAEALDFLEFAYRLGVRYFDCAASYAVAERRLGAFLKSLGSREREELVVATKFGEHWDFERGEPYVDHSYAALRASLERSLELLGRIDVLQVHKTTPEVLLSDDLSRAWEFARSCGISIFGPSVSDLASARLACEAGRYRMIQLPLNRQNPGFLQSVSMAGAAGLYVAVNRPFAMGKMLYEGVAESAREKRVAAFEFILRRLLSGVVLSGTKSKAHLTENWDAFGEARGRLASPFPSDPAY